MDLWFAWVGCAEPPGRPGPAGPPPALADEPVLSEVADAPLARRLEVAFDRPAALIVTLRTDAREVEVRFPGPADAYDVPVLGLTAGVAWEVAVAGESAGARSADLASFEVENGTPGGRFPRMTVLASDPARAEGGYWLVPLDHEGTTEEWLAVYDATDLSLAWVYKGPVEWGDARMHPSGEIYGLSGGVLAMNLLGEVTHAWTRHPQESLPGAEIPWKLDHEAYPVVEDGSFWSLAPQTTQVPLYPRSYTDPTPVAPAEIEDAHVVHFADDGTTLADWSLAERLDSSRIGFKSLDPLTTGYDWAHANAVIPDPDGGVVVSVRHQDVLASLDADGNLRWLLGDPGGWRSPWAEHLLAPIGEVTWPYHQHGPGFAADGVLWVLDNHSEDATPYAGVEPDAGASRLLGYEVDAAAGTVREVAEWYPPDGLESIALGNAAPLPRTGHVLANFGMLRKEGEVANVSNGWGANAARVMEVDPDDPDPVIDVRFYTTYDVAPGGVNVYRVFPFPSLYGDAAEVTRIR